MHRHDLRLVAVRVIDRFKNTGYNINVQTVHYMDDVPVGYCDPLESSYIMNPSLPYLGIELPDEVQKFFIDKIELAKVKATSDIDKKIEACNLPILYFPDDFQGGVNSLAK